MRHPIFVKSNGKIEKDYPIFNFSRIAGYMAGSMWNRRNLDYRVIARKALVIDQLPENTLLSSDVRSTHRFPHNLLIINSRGKVARNRRGFVSIPKFEVVQFPSIKLSDIKTRRFKMIE